MSDSESFLAKLSSREGYALPRHEHKSLISYPGDETVEWYGFRRHNFELCGRKGFIVEPPNPAPGLPWTWCLQWAEAFVPRTPALKLLERGFHHVHLDLFDTFFNPEGMRIAGEFYAMLQKLHFHKKAALIGMSYGGLFSLRWSAEHPDTVGAMYLDAPLCSLIHHPGTNVPDWEKHSKERNEQHRIAYGAKSLEELEAHPLNPINNLAPIAKAKLPILAIRSVQDQSVDPCKNIDVVEAKLKAAGLEIEVIRRDFYGHHPHGLTDPTPLVEFILRHYPEFTI